MRSQRPRKARTPRWASTTAATFVAMALGGMVSTTPSLGAWIVHDATIPHNCWRARLVASQTSTWLGTCRNDEPATDILLSLRHGRWVPTPGLPAPAGRAFVLDLDPDSNLWLASFFVNHETTYDGLRILRFDGLNWDHEMVSPGIWPQAIDMVSGDEGWIAGNHGLFLHYFDGRWTRSALRGVDSLDGKNLLALAMVGPDDGWAVGLNGLVARFQDGGWYVVDTPAALATHQLNDIAVDEDGGIWTVGEAGVIGHLAAGQWRLERPVDADLFAIEMVTAYDGWAVGDAGTVVRWNGTEWQRQPTPTQATLLDIAITPDGGWIVGRGVVLRREAAVPITLHESLRQDRFPMIRQAAERAIGADFDGDQELDLLTSTPAGLLLYRGRLDGGFHSATTVAVHAGAPPDTYRTLALAPGDIDGDGDLDLFVTGRDRHGTTMLRNNGTGAFFDATAETGLPALDGYPNQPFLIDLDGDGDLDLFVARGLASGPIDLPSVSFRNDGTGRFLPLQDDLDPVDEHVVVWGDIDADGDLDGIAVGYDGARPICYLNDGAGRLQARPLPFETNEESSGFHHQSHLADLDRDGDLDLLILGATLRYARNDGRGRFALEDGRFPPLQSTLGIRSTLSAMGDLNLDGCPEVLLQPAAGNGHRSLRLLQCRADGTYSEPIALPNPNQVSSTAAVFADWDGDGDLDLFVAGTPNGRFFENELGHRSSLTVRPRQSGGNHQAIGATVEVYDHGHFGDPGHLRGHRAVATGHNPTGIANLERLVFGLPHGGRFDIGVRFATGKRVIRRGLSAGDTVAVHQYSPVRRTLRTTSAYLRRQVSGANVPRELAELLAALTVVGMACRHRLPVISAVLAVLGYLGLTVAWATEPVIRAQAAPWAWLALALATTATGHRLRNGNRHPMRLGHFRLGKCLGTGGMAAVYEAFDTARCRRVALKVMPLRRDADRIRFLREADVMARVHHPNIIRIFEAGTTGNRAFIAMERLRGCTVAERLEQSPPPTVREILVIADALADALGALHALGVLHRDVKAENVFLTGATNQPLHHARVKLMDFGLVSEQAPTLAATEPTAIVGTVTHMPPDRLRGGPADPGTDLYGLGVLLFQALTGHHPCARADGTLTFDQLLNTTSTPLAKVRPDLPLALVQTMGQLLSASPDQRFPSAEEAGRALRHAGATLAPEARGRTARVDPEADNSVTSASTVEDSWQTRLRQTRRLHAAGRAIEAEVTMLACIARLQEESRSLDQAGQADLLTRPDVREALSLAHQLRNEPVADGGATNHET